MHSKRPSVLKAELWCVRVRMVEHVECLVGLRRELEVRAKACVRGGNGQLVRGFVPQDHDLGPLPPPASSLIGGSATFAAFMATPFASFAMSPKLGRRGRYRPGAITGSITSGSL